MISNQQPDLQAQFDVNQDQKLCTLCEKMIDKSKFGLHDARCSRMNYKCKECNMVVLKSEKSVHDEEICGKPEASSPSELTSPTETKPQAAGGSSLIEE